MDAVATGGLNTMVVGIVTVFFALTMLVAVITVMTKLLSLGNGTAATALPGDGGQTGTEATGTGRSELLARVALAAYALHAASRTSIRGPEPASAWARAARSRQILRFESSQLRR